MSDQSATQFEDLRRSFQTFYLTKLCPYLKEQEAVRLKYLRRFYKLLLCIILVFPLLMTLIYTISVKNGWDVDWSILWIPVAIGIFILRGPYAEYDRKVKTATTQRIIEFFDGFSYARGQGLSSFDLRESRIVPSFDRMSTDDCFKGQYAGVPLRVCEHILEQRHTDSKGRTNYVTVFHGLIIELEMPKSYRGETVVLKDAGIFNRFHREFALSHVRLEDPVFEKEFEVYGSDQIEARYLLTTAFMERLLKMRQLYKSKCVQASFINNKVLLSIDTKVNMFEPCSFFRSNLNKERIDTVFEQILTIFEIIHVLKLQRSNL